MNYVLRRFDKFSKFDVANLIVGFALIIVCISAIVCLVLRSRSVDDSEAQRVLFNQGYTNVVINDRGWGLATLHGCHGNDGHWYTATADNPVGKRVDVIVCCGNSFEYNGCTLRTK